MQLLMELEQVNSEIAHWEAKRKEITARLFPLAKAQHTIMRETFMRVFPEDKGNFYSEPRWIHHTGWIAVSDDGRAECWEQGRCGNMDEIIHTFPIVEITDPNAYAAEQTALWETEKQRRADEKARQVEEKRQRLINELAALPPGSAS